MSCKLVWKVDITVIQSPARLSQSLPIHSAHTTRSSKTKSATSTVTDSIMYALPAVSGAPLYRSVPASIMLPFPFDVESAFGFTVTVTSALVTDVVMNVTVLIGVGTASR